MCARQLKAITLFAGEGLYHLHFAAAWPMRSYRVLLYNGHSFFQGNTAQFPPNGLSTAPADLRAKSRRKRRLRSEAPRCGSVCEAQSALQKCSIIYTSIICAFCLAACTSRSLHRHLELCGIAIIPANRPIRQRKVGFLLHLRRIAINCGAKFVPFTQKLPGAVGISKKVFILLQKNSIMFPVVYTACQTFGSG